MGGGREWGRGNAHTALILTVNRFSMHLAKIDFSIIVMLLYLQYPSLSFEILHSERDEY